MIATVLASTADQVAGVLDSPDSAIIPAVIVVAVVGFALRGRTNVKTPDAGAKVSGLLMLGIVAVLGFGLLWEVSECVAGTHFGDPGTGANPFDQFCPVDKANGPEAATR